MITTRSRPRSALTISAHLRHPVINRALSLAPDGATVTEVGAGRGAMACRLSAAGYDYLGYEPDTDSFLTTEAALGECGGGQIYNTFLPEDPVRQSDVVVAFEVLEHIEDDGAALDNWFGWLKPGGLLIISMPAHEDRFGPGDVTVGHYRRYERSDLIGLLEGTGFAGVEVRSVGFPAGFLLEWVRNHSVSPTGTDDERTAASGRFRQPRRDLGWLTATAALPFLPVQRMFERTDLGTGYVAWAKRPPAP